MTAAMSATAAGTTLTPPSSSHGNSPPNSWKYAVPSQPEDYTKDGHALRENTNGSSQGYHTTINGNHKLKESNSYDADLHSPAYGSDSAGYGFNENKRPNSEWQREDPTDENSKWIHRDKLAKIESEELQAAGIILPKPRAQSRPRRDRSQDKAHSRRNTDASDQPVPLPRSRKNSVQTEKTVEIPAWDLRMPEEIAEDPGDFWISANSSSVKGSRIPVAKLSPLPIPMEHLERDAPVQRVRTGETLEEEPTITYPKPRSRSGSSNVLDDTPKIQPAKRSATDISPKKTPGARKASAKQGTTNRPKTRSGSNNRDVSNGSTTRPTTRSGDFSPKQPEGEPPWMVSAYRPDPRLPPDQQLLPTVARRLQQEQWEKEGKFGNVYDKEFRPLNDEGFLKPPELQKPKEFEEQQQQGEWPLRQPEPKSPTPSRPGTSSYSHMPKIQDKPVISPLPSPRGPMPQNQTPLSPIVRVPDVPEQEPEQEKKKGGGCGCCIVM